MAERVRSAGGESGQATVEWVGLVLLVAVVLGALAVLREPGADGGLGDALAARIGGAPGAGSHPARAGGTVRPPPHLPHTRALPGARERAIGRGRTRAVDALRRLRSVRGLSGVGRLSGRVWILCLGYKRFRYELDHPRPPSEPMPVGEALRIANACLNPLSFLTDG